MAHWQEREIKLYDGTKVIIHFSPNWNKHYFTSRMEDTDWESIVKVLADVYRRKPDEIWWKIEGNHVWIGNNTETNEMFHEPKEKDVTEMVFDILRNGSEKERTWSTGNSAEVWST